MALPALARLLLRLTDPRVREFLAGDLEESFEPRVAQDGLPRAAAWCTRQAAAAVVNHPWRPGARPRLNGDGVMRTFLQDLRYGSRMIRRQPGFSAVVVMTLALAIGANSVIFSFANVLLLRPLPLKNPETLAWVGTIQRDRGVTRGPLSIPEFLEYRKELVTAQALAGLALGSVTLTGRGDATRLTAGCATANLQDVWGLRFARGRGFSADADKPGAAGEVFLSHHYWQHDLGGDPRTVGQTLMLDGKPATVIGVLTPDIEIGNLTDIDVWVPLTLSPDAPREERKVRAVARLQPGVTLDQLNADLRHIAERLAREHPKTNEGWTARAASTRAGMTGADTWVILAMLSTVVGLVLLLACANLANLVLSRATGRRRELAMRSALGASRGRVIRQLLTENFLYGIGGGIAGLLLAAGIVALLKSVAYDRFFALVTVDRNVMLFAGALALITPLLFAVLPAIQTTGLDVNEVLKDGSRSAGGLRGARSRSILVVAQMSLAVMLLVVATLLVHAMRNIALVPLGIDDTHMVMARVELPAWKYSTIASRDDYFERLLATVSALPGVRSAAFAERLPFVDPEPTTDITIEGRTMERERRPWAVATTVSDRYFDAAGIRVVAGRTFTTVDRRGRLPVAIINTELARRYWGTPSAALGARLSLGASGSADNGPVQVVGVVADVLRADREGVNPQVYVAARQRPLQSISLIIKSDAPSQKSGDLRARLAAVDRDVPVANLRTMQQALDEDLSSSRVLASLFAGFALLALVLATSGLYAVVSYSASQRVKEIGVRVALGAAASDIVSMMVRQAARLVVIGLVIGLVGGRVLAMGAATILYNLSPSDPATYAGVAVTLSAIALLATYVPVRRATAIDPVSALRLE